MMEPQSRKRGREGDMEDNKIDTSDNSFSKRELVGVSYEHSNNHGHRRDKKLEDKSDCNDEGLDEGDYCMSSLGVFDFPWLREGDGMIFGSEDGESKVEDAFSLSFLLPLPADHGMELRDPWLCQNSGLLLDSPGNDHDMLSPEQQQSPAQDSDDLEGRDCIWSSVLNQPLEGGF